MEMSLVTDGSRVAGGRAADGWVSRSMTLQRRPEVREGKEAKSPKRAPLKRTSQLEGLTGQVSEFRRRDPYWMESKRTHTQGAAQRSAAQRTHIRV